MVVVCVRVLLKAFSIKCGGDARTFHIVIEFTDETIELSASTLINDKKL